MLSLRSIRMLMLQFILTVPVNETNKRKTPKLDTSTKGRLKAAYLSVQTALALPRLRVRCKLHAQE